LFSVLLTLLTKLHRLHYLRWHTPVSFRLYPTFTAYNTTSNDFLAQEFNSCLAHVSSPEVNRYVCYSSGLPKPESEHTVPIVLVPGTVTTIGCVLVSAECSPGGRLVKSQDEPR